MNVDDHASLRHNVGGTNSDSEPPPAGIRDPVTGEWVNSRDSGLVWDAAMGGWVEPVNGPSRVRTAFDPATGQWNEIGQKPYIDPETGRWVGGPRSGQIFRNEKHSLLTLERKLMLAGMAYLFAIFVLLNTSHSPPASTPSAQPTSIPQYQYPGQVPATPSLVPTYAPATPYPGQPGLPGDFTN